MEDWELMIAYQPFRIKTGGTNYLGHSDEFFQGTLSKLRKIFRDLLRNLINQSRNRSEIPLRISLKIVSMILPLIPSKIPPWISTAILLINSFAVSHRTHREVCRFFFWFSLILQSFHPEVCVFAFAPINSSFQKLFLRFLSEFFTEFLQESSTGSLLEYLPGFVFIPKVFPMYFQKFSLNSYRR